MKVYLPLIYDSLNKTPFGKVCAPDPVGKIAKKNSLKEPYCQKYTPTDRFFGDFDHWEDGRVSVSAVNPILGVETRNIM